MRDCQGSSTLTDRQTYSYTHTHSHSSPQHVVEASVKVDVPGTFILVVELPYALDRRTTGGDCSEEKNPPPSVWNRFKFV